MSPFQSYFDAPDAYLDCPFVHGSVVAVADGWERAVDHMEPDLQAEEVMGPDLLDWVIWFSASAASLQAASLSADLVALDTVAGHAADLAPAADASRASLDGFLNTGMETKMMVNMLQAQAGYAPGAPGFMP